MKTNIDFENSLQIQANLITKVSKDAYRDGYKERGRELLAELEKINKIEKIKTHPCNCCSNPDDMADKRCPSCYYGDGWNKVLEKIKEEINENQNV